MIGPRRHDWVTNAPGDAIDAWQSIHFPYRTAGQLGLPTTEDGIIPMSCRPGPGGPT